jgi:signal transduction histidine kinase/CheY-like chemotaxis protein
LLVLTVLAVGTIRPAVAASWAESGLGAPLLRTFTVRETGTLAPYRRSLLARDGRLYVAHDGLSVFDGETWRLLPLPEKSIVRALTEAPDGAIWVGGDNLLGRIVRLPGGVPEYRSALPQLPSEYQRDLGSVGTVFVSPKDQIVVVTENRVFDLTSNSVRVWSLPAPRRLAAWVDAGGKLIIVRPGIETLRVTESGLVPTEYPTALATAGVDWAVHFDDGSSLVGAGRQLIRLRGDQIEPLSGAVADLLREDRVAQAVRLPGDFAALATLRHGIRIVDATGMPVTVLEAPGDLPDNRIVHLAAGPDGCLVATTPEAIVVLNDTLRATVFDSRHGLSPKRVASIARNDHGLFVANDHRVLQLNSAEPAQPAGVWQSRAEEHETLTALLPLGANLVTASPSELQLLAPGIPAPLSLRSAEVIAPCAWSAQPDGLAWIEDSRFYRGALVEGRLVALADPVEIDHDACSLTEDVVGAHWIATARAGVLRVAPVDQIRAGKPPIRTYRENLRFTGNLTPRVFRVGPRVLVTTDNGLAVYSDAGDRFATFPGLAGARVHAVATASTDTVWLAISQRDRLPFQINLARLRYSAEGLVCELADLPPLPLEESPAALFADVSPDSAATTLWLGLNGRVLRLETGAAPVGPPAAPSVTALTLFDDDRSIRPLVEPRPRIAFDNAGLRFDVHVPAGRLGQRVHLETRLEGFDADWVPLGEIPSRVFRGLRDGSYRFEARAIDTLGRPSPVATLAFAVQPPWWRSAPAYIAYALSLVFLSAFVFLTRLRLARAHHRELEALVAQRTRELAAANSAKSEFLAHINHEIRNPLNGVIGLSSMLANIHQDENTRRLARSLKACAGYLASVVDNVLDLARIEAGRIEISPLRFDPRTLVEDITEMFRLQIEEAGGRISWSADPELPSGLVGDVHRIRQVLVNFTANAARYARGGDVRLSVRRRDLSHNRITVVFTVADTGPGIAPSEQERIFEKFSRGSSAAGDAPRGYGVGLALVRDLATLLGGEADVDSQIGHGAKFRLTVPLDIAPEPEVPARPAPGTGTNCLRVLVIDDQAFNRLVLRDHLERLGCKVEESADGTSAHLLLQARAHHMAFVDLDLPGLDGLALLRRVRSERDDNPVYLVATTASATRGIQEQALTAGADAFLPKPISGQQLAALLRECSGRVAPAPASASGASGPPPPSPGLFADLPLTPDLIRSLHAELDVETQSLVSSWRLTDQAGARRHAHRIASLAIIARDTDLVQAARHAEDTLQSDRAHASRAVDALQSAARDRLRLLATTVSASGQDRKN